MLDQCWDLLRERRARCEFGFRADEARVSRREDNRRIHRLTRPRIKCLGGGSKCFNQTDPKLIRLSGAESWSWPKNRLRRQERVPGIEPLNSEITLCARLVS